MSDSKSRHVRSETDDPYPSAYYDGPNLGEDCSNSWLHYLQMLNGVCAAGARVAAKLRMLTCKLGTNLYSKDFPGVKDWETITNALLEATLAVHSQTLPVIKYFNSPIQEHHILDQSYQQKVIENIISVVNLQYRFCVTSCSQLNQIVENKHTKYTNDIYDVDSTSMFPQMHNLSIPSPNQSDDAVMLNSYGSLYPLKNDSMQGFHSAAKSNMEKPPDLKDSLVTFFPGHRMDNFVCNQRDENSPISNEKYQIDQDNSTYNSVLQKCPMYNEPKFLQSSNGKILHFSNFTPNLKPHQNLTCKFKELRNIKNDTTWWNSQAAFLSTNVGPNAPTICFELPSTSGLNKQIQSAQLRRWSEAAAHAASGRNDDTGNVRRWSVPWDGGKPILSDNTSHWNEKYNSRDKNWIEEQDSLDTAIFLLSFRSNKGVSNLDNASKRQCSSENQSLMRPYSIWSGSGT